MIKDAPIGSTFEFGEFPQDHIESTGLLWVLAAKADDKALMVCSRIIESEQYASNRGGVTKWLNGEFFANVFAKLSTNGKWTANSGYTDDLHNVDDSHCFVFSLTKADFLQYIKTIGHSPSVTKRALRHGLDQSSNSADWLLTNGHYVKNGTKGTGIRPAFQVSLETGEIIPRSFPSGRL